MRKFQMLIVLLLTIFIGCSNSTKRVIPENLVYEAILADDSRSLISFFNSGFSPDYRDENGISLLDMAIKYDSIESLKIITRKDIDLDESLFKVRSFQALEILVENGGNINGKDTRGESLLTYYIKRKPDTFSKYLIDKGVLLNVEDNSGWKPIFWASSVGNPEILRELLKKGVNPLELDREGNYPIYYATDREKLDILLEYEYNLNQKNLEGENILGEVLIKAVANREFEIIEKLVKKGVDPNYHSYGRGAMDIAKRAKDTEMLEFLKKF